MLAVAVPQWACSYGAINLIPSVDNVTLFSNYFTSICICNLQFRTATKELSGCYWCGHLASLPIDKTVYNESSPDVNFLRARFITNHLRSHPCDGPSKRHLCTLFRPFTTRAKVRDLHDVIHRYQNATNRDILSYYTARTLWSSAFKPFQRSGTLCSNYDCSWNPCLLRGLHGRNLRPKAKSGEGVLGEMAASPSPPARRVWASAIISPSGVQGTEHILDLLRA